MIGFYDYTVFLTYLNFFGGIGIYSTSVFCTSFFFSVH